jgi:predicted nucleotidyltransferase
MFRCFRKMETSERKSAYIRYNRCMDAIEKPGTKDNIDIRKALRRFKSELDNLYGDNVPSILIYGSYARGEPSLSSDVDVLLVYSYEINPGQEIKRLSKVLSELNLRYQVLVSLFPTVDKVYQRSEGAFWRNIRREGVPFDAI